MRVIFKRLILFCAVVVFFVSGGVQAELLEDRGNYSFPEYSLGELFRQLGRQEGIQFVVKGNDGLAIKRRNFADATVEEVIQGILPVGSAIVWEYHYGKLSVVEVSIVEGGRMLPGEGKGYGAGARPSIEENSSQNTALPPPMMRPPPPDDPAFRFRSEVYEGRGLTGQPEVSPPASGGNGKGQGLIIPPPVVPMP